MARTEKDWAEMTDQKYLEVAEQQIWLSSFAANNPRAPAHLQTDLAYAEAKRREKPWLYQRAWNSAYRSCGYEPTDNAKAAIAALEPVTDAPNWEGFGRDLLESWPVRDVDGSELFDAALRNGLIREIPGGYDPEQHIDAEGICPEKGDPWYEYAFGALAERAD